MSQRASITQALVAKLKEINGTAPYTVNMFDNVYAEHKFWDEISDFPAIYVVPGSETRDYLPSSFKWGYLNISLKLYVKGEVPVQELEALLVDVERCIDNNRTLVYNVGPGQQTTEIDITSIVTDEGLLVPYGVGEINIMVRYQVLN